jgi:RNA polymerase sigma-70 factor (ECF subfamily)
VFLKVMRELAQFRGESAFSTWLHRLAINVCLDRSRRRRVDAVAADPSVLDARAAQAPGHDDVFAEAEASAAVQRAVARLPAKLRAAILLRYFDDLSYAEMASVLQCSAGTVASRLSRGHRLLATTLSSLRRNPRAARPERS